jgi:hypothetical protein
VFRARSRVRRVQYHWRSISDAMSANRAAVDWLRIVRGEYIEMPGLCLTQAECRRLWGLDDRTCGAILHALVEEEFLYLSADGRYTLASQRTVSGDAARS